MRPTYFLSLALVVLVTSAMGPADPTARGDGAISGTVTFTGTPPKMRPIDMAKEWSCAKEHPTPVMTESVVTGLGNSVQWVVVYISAGEASPTAAPATTVRYDQKGCEYIPHVAAMQAGQPLEIYNGDQTSHNIHPLPKVNAEWNRSTPAGSPPIKTSYDKPEFIAVKCNIHPWMHGYFAVMGTSHYAVTGNDGTFSLKGLPAGKYTVTAWHERFGTQSQEVTVAAGDVPKVDFVFKALPY